MAACYFLLLTLDNDGQEKTIKILISLQSCKIVFVFLFVCLFVLFFVFSFLSTYSYNIEKKPDIVCF